MAPELSEAVEEDPGQIEEQETKDWADRRLSDPSVRRRVEELRLRAKEGKSSDAGITSQELLDQARAQR